MQAAILLSSSVCQARAAHSRTVLPIVSRFASGIVVIVFVIIVIVIVIVIIVFVIAVSSSSMKGIFERPTLL